MVVGCQTQLSVNLPILLFLILGKMVLYLLQVAFEDTVHVGLQVSFHAVHNQLW